MCKAGAGGMGGRRTRRAAKARRRSAGKAPTDRDVRTRQRERGSQARRKTGLWTWVSEVPRHLRRRPEAPGLLERVAVGRR